MLNQFPEAVESLRRAANLAVADKLFCEELREMPEAYIPNTPKKGVNENPKRKIIQITGSNNHSYSRITALCNDGTVWELNGVIWTILEPIPQGDDD